MISHDDVYPRTAEHRFRLYGRDTHGNIHVIATAPDPEGIGLALVTTAREHREAGLNPEIVGVLDAVERKWLTALWEGRS